MPNQSLDLRFGPGTSTGFTPAGIAAFTDLRPAAVVRELIQNALDAAQEADEQKAVIRFRLTQKKKSQIPGIRSYNRAFINAIKTHEKMGGGKLPSQAELVVKTIRAALDQNVLDVLSVLDNGIGLNKRRMTALLSDGISAKGGNATGTYGNGHSVAIPASDLRYVLYGGVMDNGHKIGAGHAVLASHNGTGNNKEHPCAGDGFLVLGFRNGTNGNLYDFAKSSDIPEIITDDLENIRDTSRHGTAVMIPAFNHFREEKKSLWKMVAQAAACNFFEAIERRKLEVQVEDLRPEGDHSLNVLDHSTLAKTLEEYREKRRTGAFLSGHRAFEAYDVLRLGRHHSIQTSYGKIRVRLFTQRSGNARIDLCRNGMWIADDKEIPGFYYKFRDRVPFHAVLLLNSDSGGELHRLVRDAEGPLHDSIRTKDLSKEDKKKLHQGFGEIRDWLLRNTQEISDESYSPDDFLTLDFGDEGKGLGGASRNSFWGTPIAVGQRAPDRTRLSTNTGEGKPQPESNNGSGQGNATRPRNRPVLRSFLRAVSVPVDDNRRRIQIECEEGCENAELRLRVDENLDATCDSLRQDEVTPVVLSEVTVDGQRPNEASLVKENGHIVGVRLGNLSTGSSIQVETDYRLTRDFELLPGAEPSLRVDIFEAISDTSPGEGT